MPEISTLELYNYRTRRTLQELSSYRRLVRQIRTDGAVKEPVVLATDGQHVILEDGHQRVHAAMELGIGQVPVQLVQRPFGPKRKVRYPLGPEVQALMNPPEPSSQS